MNKSKSGQPWTTTEIRLLKTNYLIMDTYAMARMLGRSVFSIWARAKMLGLKKAGSSQKSIISLPITPAQVSRLFQNTSAGKKKAYIKANRLGLKREKK